MAFVDDPLRQRRMRIGPSAGDKKGGRNVEATEYGENLGNAIPLGGFEHEGYLRHAH
jgi:hypothetical protein